MKLSLLLIVSFLSFSIYGIANPTVSAKHANQYVGERVSICGKVTGGKAPATNASRSTILQLFDVASSSSINVVIKHEDRKNFSFKPEEYLYHKQVCITGVIAENNGRTELLIRRQDEIKFEDPSGGSDIRPLDFDGLNRFFEEE